MYRGKLAVSFGEGNSWINTSEAVLQDAWKWSCMFGISSPEFRFERKGGSVNFANDLSEKKKLKEAPQKIFGYWFRPLYIQAQFLRIPCQIEWICSKSGSA